MRLDLRSSSAAIGLVLLAALLCPAAQAEVKEVAIARQYGVSYLPFMVMEQNKLLEKHARASGLGEISVKWATFAGGAAMNDALISGNLDFASAGVPPFATLWAKTRASLGVKGVCAMSSLPSYLITRNPAIKSIADFGPADRIALPAVKVSNQAIYLQMAAAQAFGIENYNRLDKYTVTMSFADSTVAMLAGAGDLNSNFVSPPYAQQQLEKPGMHAVLNSNDVMGGPTTLILVYATTRFHDANPKTYAAFVAAMSEAVRTINADKKAASALYVRLAKSSDSAESIEKIIADPQVDYSLTPRGIVRYTDFMNRVGSIDVKPASWKELFFADAHALPGS
ncbi:MAG: ABC transporter substrate-binding protein [Pseudomonadota bacterium]|nr:ABC transporter substrate-binding protein [Pseudomonadota bacterium]